MAGKTVHGLLVRTPDGWAEVAFEHGSFRLSVCSQGPPAEPASVFLRWNDTACAPVSKAHATGAAAASFRRVRVGAQVGISSDTGTLLIDPRTGAWTLRDATGRTLVRPLVGTTAAVPDPMHSAVEIANAPKPEPAGLRKDTIELQVGWRRDTPLRGFGCGNGALSLQHASGASDVGNGWAVIPFLWCPDGYAMLAVTGDDRHPASWRGDAARSSVIWTFPGQVAHLYLTPAADLKQAVHAMAELTGYAPVPPRWTFGYLQSRWGWRSHADLESVFREFRKRRFPVDAFILDFEWYTAEPDYEVPPRGLPRFPDFAVNHRLLPRTLEQIARFHERGLRIVPIRKPRMGDRATLAGLRKRGWMLPQPADGTRKWSVREIDFSRPEVRAWYAGRLQALVSAGFDAWWNDEGESSFVTYHYWNLAELEVQRRVRPRERFWSLNRAFSPGLQRLGATAWTGDAYATWDALAATPVHLLNWGLAGMPYGGSDSGGFRGEASPELFVRWIQAAVFFPMMRAHTSHEWTPRFPWLYGRAAEAALKKAFVLRYRLIPYLYSLAHETSSTGLPLMRPLAMEFPADALACGITDQWLVGSRVMAAPILGPGTQRRVYLPEGAWYRFGTAERFEGGRVLHVTAALDEIPVFVRAGTILPLGPEVHTSTADLTNGVLEVQVYPGADATFTLVEDDGTTVAYAEGDVRRTAFRWDDGRGKLTRHQEGPYAGPTFRDTRVNVMSRTAPRQVRRAQARPYDAEAHANVSRVARPAPRLWMKGFS